MTKIYIPNKVLLNDVSSILRSGSTVTIRVKGGSMRPMILGDRDMVVLMPITTIKRMDSVLARLSDGKYVLHRVMSVQGDRVVLMGDANIIQREYCLVADVVGVVTSIIRDGKRNINCNGLSWRLCSHLWVKFLPLRGYLNRIIDIL